MDKAAKEKFINSIVPKYAKADRNQRSELLDQIVNKLKIHRKSAIRLLRGYLKSGAKKKASSKKSSRAGKKRK